MKKLVALELGFIYANLSEAQVYERLGYRTFFHSISNARKRMDNAFRFSLVAHSAFALCNHREV